MALGLAICTPLLAPAAAQDGAMLETLRQADMRLATVGARISTAMAPFCDRLEPGLGLQLQTIAQYAQSARPAVRAHFRMRGDVGIEGVIAGGPAERAGLRTDDSVISIAGVPVGTASSSAATTDHLVALHARIADLPPDQPVTFVVQRGEQTLNVRVTPQPACRTRYELQIGNRFEARANGEMVQISSRYIEDVDPDLFPAVVAHELAHNILRHKDRLEAAGADFGLASGFGQNVGLFRQTEIQADILSVDILARAGYDPRIAETFWRTVGPRLLQGQIRRRSHPPFRDRAALVAAEAKRIATAGRDAKLPDFYDQRNATLDGDWRKLTNGVKPGK
ncbi:M48 family metallopeptidase [Sphingomonas sp.]|uniref:M48 family metallopeptidase n=1 Tax=Sphingomonas sp. TaxID=28214 RepID=UPI001EBB2D5F|nr:M48 family metallopeptidase [Sphingomonas sp.]MBX3594736.1 PDZ domain-containing protein [Sphingomonas sp.]